MCCLLQPRPQSSPLPFDGVLIWGVLGVGCKHVEPRFVDCRLGLFGPQALFVILDQNSSTLVSETFGPPRRKVYSLVQYLRATVTTCSVVGNTSASIRLHRGYAKVALGYTRADECTRQSTNAYVNNPVLSIYTPIA
jgi:hypothetical protein